MCNVDRVVRFCLDGWTAERRLVAGVIEDLETEVSVSSPVGRALAGASVGERLVVAAPAGDLPLEVLAIASPVAGEGGGGS